MTIREIIKRDIGLKIEGGIKNTFDTFTQVNDTICHGGRPRDFMGMWVSGFRLTDDTDVHEAQRLSQCVRDLVMRNRTMCLQLPAVLVSDRSNLAGSNIGLIGVGGCENGCDHETVSQPAVRRPAPQEILGRGEQQPAE